jgi:predicted ArsR family transcriptional regulator
MSFPPINPEWGGTRARIVEILRRSPMSANELAESLGMTHNAVRSHLSTLLRMGMIREIEQRRSRTKPVTVYGVEPQAESSLSRAYMPFLAHLLESLETTLPESQLEAVMRDAGKHFGDSLPKPRGSALQRTEAAAEVLNELGALVHVESEDGSLVIRGHGCLLAEAIHGRRAVCRAMETLLENYLSLPVTECCNRGDRPHCCFRVKAA